VRTGEELLQRVSEHLKNGFLQREGGVKRRGGGGRGKPQETRCAKDCQRGRGGDGKKRTNATNWGIDRRLSSEERGGRPRIEPRLKEGEE